MAECEPTLDALDRRAAANADEIARQGAVFLEVQAELTALRHHQAMMVAGLQAIESVLTMALEGVDVSLDEVLEAAVSVLRNLTTEMGPLAPVDVPARWG